MEAGAAFALFGAMIKNVMFEARNSKHGHMAPWLGSAFLALALVGCEWGSETVKESDSTSQRSDEGEGNAGSEAQGRGCAEVEDWDEEWSRYEREVLDLVNQRRAEGADCGSRGSFDAAPALTAHLDLRCAARLHSQDMAQRGYFDHRNPEGESPFARVNKTDFKGNRVGENIAAGQRSPEEVMRGWMKSDGHCANIMEPRYRYLGVGYAEDSDSKYQQYWTQNFGG